MQISDRCVVSFHYTLNNTAGEELETSKDSDPSAYLHGANNIIRGLEQAMTGHEAGDQFAVELEAAAAYGEYKPDLKQRVPMKHLVFKGKLKPGMIVQLSTDQGARTVTVIKAGRHSANIDANHPLAGQSLSFDIEIVEVRAASAEEASHGHAHGAGGHQH